MLAQVKRTFLHALPARQLASPSITRFDLCNILDVSGVEKIPDLLGTFPSPDFAGATCELETGNFYLDLEEAIVRSDILSAEPTTLIDGHELQVDGDAHECDVSTIQGETADYLSHEILDLDVQTSLGIGKTALCKDGEKAMIDVLNTTHLK
jgi:hypothetical protein